MVFFGLSYTALAQIVVNTSNDFFLEKDVSFQELQFRDEIVTNKFDSIISVFNTVESEGFKSMDWILHTFKEFVILSNSYVNDANDFYEDRQYCLGYVPLPNDTLYVVYLHGELDNLFKFDSDKAKIIKVSSLMMNYEIRSWKINDLHISAVNGKVVK